MIACRHPRCIECGHPIAITEIEQTGRWHRHCCTFCRASVQVRTTPDGYAIRSAAEAMRLPTAPLPAVASPALRGRFFAACSRVAQLLRPCDPVEPGMATMVEPPRREVVEPLRVVHGAVSGCEASQNSYPQPHAAVTGKRGTVVPA